MKDTWLESPGATERKSEIGQPDNTKNINGRWRYNKYMVVR